jgi:type III secretion protein U
MFLVLGLVISGVLLWTLRSGLSSSGGLVGADPAVVLAWGGQSILFLFAAAVLLLLAFGVFEWLLNKRNLMRELSMSVDEVRREYREDEGDPILKYTRRAMHESLALQDLERRVRQARVIVVERNSLDGPDSS